MRFYHVTLEGNFYSIIHHGVMPDFSTGSRLVSWWVSEENIPWALSHVSARTHIDTSKMIIFIFDNESFKLPQGVSLPRFARFAQPNVYTCRTVVPVDKWILSRDYFGRIEKEFGA